MHTIATADLIAAWERGQPLTLSGKAEALLAMLGGDPAQRDRLSVGQRDALLMDLRNRLFGAQVSSVAACPACGERLELTFALNDVRVPPPGDPTAEVDLEHDGFAIRAHPPTAGDLARLDAAGLGENRRDLLLERCVLDARHGDQAIPIDRLPAKVVSQLAARLAEADPQADVQLALRCPACDHGWTVAFDIVSFFWHELDGLIRRVLREVHTLARAYGWREADILAMSARRRAAYLELVRA